MRSKIFSDKQIEYIIDNSYGLLKSELLEMLNKQFETNFTFNQLNGFMKRNGIKTGLSMQFKKGAEPWNKGFSYQPGGRNIETRFKKGHKAINKKPIGSERLSNDGYVIMKIGEPSTWKLKHRYLWEKKNGKLKKNQILIFLNLDKTDCRLDNLMVIDRSQIPFIANSGLLSTCGSITRSVVYLSQLDSVIKRKMKEAK